MRCVDKYILLVITAILAGGCSVRHADEAMRDMPHPDKGQVWQLVEMRGREVKGGTTVTLTLNPETGVLHGRAQCNDYYADFAMLPRGGRYALGLSNMGCGETSCPDADMNAEARYLSLLGRADAMTMDEYTMILYCKGKEILKYELQ